MTHPHNLLTEDICTDYCIPQECLVCYMHISTKLQSYTARRSSPCMKLYANLGNSASCILLYSLPLHYMASHKHGELVLCGVAEEQLRYSIETWTCQLHDFVTEVIQQPVYLAGNSLGGLLSAHLAATQAHLCRCESHTPLVGVLRSLLKR